MAVAALPIYGALRAQGQGSPSETVRIAVMGLGRGLAHVDAALGLKNAKVVALCDIDDQRLSQGIQSIKRKDSNSEVKGFKDFRNILDDQTVDAFFIAAPNHWHAPAAIMACKAGKHVYVEKPGSQNPHEAELIVAAAKKYKRIVQLGNQRRSWPALVEMVERLKSGVIGKVHYSRTYYNNSRGSIGKGKPATPPGHIDYNLWQGPAPERPYKDNLVHYNWHWHWHWGNGEIGNNGIHALDVARWGLGVDYPKTVSYTGGRYHFDDDQETPDTGVANFDFGSKGAMWDGSSCNPRSADKLPFVAFYGENGIVANFGSDYKVFDLKGKEWETKKGPGGDIDHIRNFLECIKSGKKPNSDIEDTQKSTLLCHLGNIAYRTGSTLKIDQHTGRIIGNPEAQKLWKREYRSGWEPSI